MSRSSSVKSSPAKRVNKTYDNYSLSIRDVYDMETNSSGGIGINGYVVPKYSSPY